MINKFFDYNTREYLGEIEETTVYWLLEDVWFGDDRYVVYDDAGAEYGRDYFVERADENEHQTCDVCGCSDDTVSYEIDPYVQGMSGEEEWRFFCGNCYTNAVMDI